MRFCQDHWDRLRQAIEDRGLGDLIASSGATVAQQVAQDDQKATWEKIQAESNRGA